MILEITGTYDFKLTEDEKMKSEEELIQLAEDFFENCKLTEFYFQIENIRFK